MSPLDASPADTPTVTEITLGVLGAGNVGAALIGLIADHGDDIEARTGIRLRVGAVAVRSTSRERGVAIDPSIVTTDAAAVVADDEIDLVVELIGGIEPARELIADALKAGKPVVTANKELLANVGSDLAEVADGAGVDLLFEAAVAGGVPFIRPLRESLVGEPISRIMGIVNGTTNYILSQMDTEGVSYADALASAQSLGYAERDPTADVEGFDAAAKAAIIASIAFGVRVVAGDVAHEGISEVSAADINFARRLGYTIKLLAICERFDDGSIAARVHPAMVSVDHPLSGVRDSYNAVFVEGDVVGNLMFYGRGAGGGPTASAVLGDVIDAATNLSRGTHASLGHLAKAKLRSVDDLSSPYYVNVEVRDQPGVLAQVASVFGNHNVSIRSMEQEGLDDEARIVFITHDATERNVQACLTDLRRLDSVAKVASVLRVVAE